MCRCKPNFLVKLNLLILSIPYLFLLLILSAWGIPETSVLAGIDESEGNADSVTVGDSDEPRGLNEFFEEYVWARVGERTCLRCHKVGGDAGESQFILQPVEQTASDADDALKHNRRMFELMATSRPENPQTSVSSSESRLILKVTGNLDHGGGEVLKEDSTGLRILRQFVQRLADPISAEDSTSKLLRSSSPKLFDGLTKLSPARRLRRITLSLAGRLPSGSELSEAEQAGDAAVSVILDRILHEDAFYERLKEGFNDIFLTVGIEDNAETLLSYHHFEKTRLWYQHHDFSGLPEAERERAGWKLADVYRQALLQEPLRMIEYIVRNDRPFTEIATADYIMVSPYTAKGYGIFDSIRDQFKNPEDPFEYIPARLSALTGRDGKTQESLTGLYPHAGFLSMFHYLRRYPSTETNRNRLRARMFYQHFLGIDVMQLAPRSTDASAVAAKYEIPTMQAPDCVVCHRTIDPVAGIFQDFDFEGHVIPRKEGWYTDMFQAGFEGEDMPVSERWRAPQWLAERTVRDPRFATAMVEHVYYILFGRRVLQPPDDIDDPYFGSRRRAYLAQRKLIEKTAREFSDGGFNLKTAFRGLIDSDFYRVDGVQAVSLNPDRAAALDDMGLVRLLSPEQLERKLKAIFGREWGRLEGETKILYGGIDSISITERNADPSGAMGAIQRILANDVACYHVAREFRKPSAERQLFATIEPAVVPGDEMSNQQIRHTIIGLHKHLLGQDLSADDAEIERTFNLFADIIADANAQGRLEPRETYFCGGREDFRTEDPLYTIRAWRGVVTYLLRQHEFLYE